jgi:hypothetical protein
MTKNESSLVWELVRETTGEVLRTSHQTVEEFGLHACGPELALACVDAIPRSVLDAQNEDEIIIPDALACADVIPREMISDSNEGEWSRDGLRFVHEGQEYLVRCRIQDYSQSAGYRVTDCGPCGTVEMINELARRGYVVLEREKYFRLLREATDGGK